MTTTTIDQREAPTLRNDWTEDVHRYTVAKAFTRGPGGTAVRLHLRGHSVMVCGTAPDQDHGFTSSAASTWLGDYGDLGTDVAAAALVQGF